MALTFLDIYNAVAEQAWSMYDADAESLEDFESGLKTSINKALTELWCSYPFPFRVIEYTLTTVEGQAKYDMPTGNIYRKTVGDSQKYSVKIGKEYLNYVDNIDTLDDANGKPTLFQVYNDNLLFYPSPDGEYEIKIEYLELAIGEDRMGDKLYELKEETDEITVTEKYEVLFKNALVTKAMCYAIASKQDENYAGYLEQYENAYKTLVSYCIGIDKDKRVVI